MTYLIQRPLFLPSQTTGGGTSNFPSSTFHTGLFKHPENQNLTGNIVYPLPRCYC